MRDRIDLDAVPAVYRDVRSWATKTREQREKHVRNAIGSALAGSGVGRALGVAGKSLVFTDTDSLLDVLRSPVTVQVRCWEVGASSSTRLHKVTFTPGGEVTLHHHGEVDLDGEMIMGALAGDAQPCLLAAAVLPDAAPVPSWASSGRQAIESGLRPLHTAMAWAQDPGTDWAWVREHRLCDHGVTPTVRQAWLDAGFTFKQAHPFWVAKVSIERALPWLAAGLTSKSAASEAARGNSPDGQDGWREAGFALTSSLPWKRSGVSPQDARALTEDGFTASTFGWVTNAGMQREEAVAWVRAGVPVNDLLGWWQHCGDLDTSLTWCRAGLGPYAYLTVHAVMDVEEAGAWVRAGFAEPLLGTLTDAHGPIYTLLQWHAFRVSPLGRSFEGALRGRPGPIGDPIVTRSRTFTTTVAPAR